MIPKNKPLIICSHPRSGSNFLFNAIRFNTDVFDFPKDNATFFSSIEHLLLPGDKSIVDDWISWFERNISQKNSPIIRTNCLPEDLQKFVKLVPSNKATVKIVKYILKKGIFLYIKRDPLETLVSWYKYAKSGGTITSSGSGLRLQNTKLNDFCNIPNLHKLPHRNFENYDLTTISFLAKHHLLWKKFIKKNKNGYIISYSDLKYDYEKTINNIFYNLKKDFNLIKIPKNYFKPATQNKAKYFRKIWKILNYLFFLKNFKFFKKFENKIIFNMSSSQSPAREYDKNLEISSNYKKTINKLYRRAIRSK